MLAALVLLATFAMVGFNALAAAGFVNGVTPDAVSARYPTVLTPAGYAFSIWSLIYLGMVAFSVYQLLPANLTKFSRVRVLYLVTCVLNCAWIWCWHHDLIAACFVIIFLLLATLLLICSRLRGPASFVDSLFSKAPFGIYAGWVTVATLVNLTILLGIVGINAQSRLLGVAFIILAAACAVAVRWRIANYLFPIAVAWGLTAVAVKQSGNTPIVIAAAFATVTCLVTAGSVVTNLKDSTSE